MLQDVRNQALSWLIATSGLSLIFTWGSINACHLRFRRAWKLNGHTLDELAFRSQPGIIGSWIGLSFNFLVLVRSHQFAMTRHLAHATRPRLEARKLT